MAAIQDGNYIQSRLASAESMHYSRIAVVPRGAQFKILHRTSSGTNAVPMYMFSFACTTGYMGTGTASLAVASLASPQQANMHKALVVAYLHFHPNIHPNKNANHKIFVLASAISKMAVTTSNRKVSKNLPTSLCVRQR